MHFALITAILSVTGFAASIPVDEFSTKAGCGYESCPAIDPDKINVHLVPHSHDDVGWLKTVDQYYYGNKINIQRANVESIIDSVVKALQENPDRKFIQVESAFFWKWWINHEDKHEIVKNLVESGQLEFIGGAWSMNDEANTHYQSTIDQFTLGLRFLNDTFGECASPKIGWQIDPFGHSREMASIFSQLGYDALYFARLDWRDKSERLQTKTPEMVWQGSPNLGTSSNLFTSVLYKFYMHPDGFCFDILCSDEYIIDDETSEEYNVGRKISDFVDFIHEQSQYYRTNNIILTFGGDFTYQDATLNYINMDKLIKHTNLLHGDTINVMYSTPSCYVKSVHDMATANGVSFPLKTDDFFPYANDPHAYWTGYFTSRPTQKRFERQGNNLLQVTKQLFAMVKAKTNADLGAILPLQQAIGIMQHHDAITGTEKQHVAQDYARIVAASFDEANKDVGLAVKALAAKLDTAPALGLKTCILTNVSICDVTNEDKFIAVVYNPLSRVVSQHVRLPVNGGGYSITGPEGEELIYQLTPAIHDFNYIEHDTRPSLSDLVFVAKDLPPLGMKMYYVEKTAEWTTILPDESPERLQLGSDNFGCTIDEASGLLKEVKNGQMVMPVKQEFLWYQGAIGNNMVFENRSSGAYIFRPDPTNNESMPISMGPVSATVYKGEILDEVHQIVNEWVRQIIRVYKNENYIEFDWLVGPIPVDDDIPKEIISKFTTDLHTEKTFFTDSNGREMLQRVRDFRPTYTYTNEEPVAGNYYPITSRIVLQDIGKNVQFSILNDRAQGGSSINDGEVELMIHRRLLRDDAFGVEEALNETEFGSGLVVRGQHFMLFGEINGAEKTMSAEERQLAQKKILNPWTFVASTSDLDLTQLQDNYNLDVSGLAASLPDNVQILTFEHISDGQYILRLEHILEETDDPNLSQPAQIDIESMFSNLKITSAQETTLGANKWIEDNNRLEWNTSENLNFYKYYVENTKKYEFTSHASQNNKIIHKSTRALNIDLNPMEIRTFIVTVTQV